MSLDTVDRTDGVAGGQVCLRGTGVLVRVVASRFMGGDSFAELARDYDVPMAVIEGAIRVYLFGLVGHRGDKARQRMIDMVENGRLR